MPRVLVTGAARGIGRATAELLAQRGWEVVAGVRRPQDGEVLAAHSDRITPLQLDITSESDLAGLDGQLPSEIDALVNNAGIVVTGPVEAVPAADLRRQLEVNVVAQAAVTQALLPRLRRARGRIVFISSLSGRVATPMFGPYNASKFGLEGMADALRLELAPWGIRVSLVEPAQTDTDLWRQAEDTFDEAAAALSPEHRELYGRHLAGYRKTIPRSQRAAVPATRVAEAVHRALTDRRPRARYVVGKGARAQAVMAQLTPTRAMDLLIRAGTGVPRRAS